MLEIPERFNKNAAEVRAMGSPADTGARLIQYMCQRLGVQDLQGDDTLDFGCGCRFADAIINKKLPVKSYTGIDVDREMIEFIRAHAQDSRLRFFHWDAYNPHYNPGGFHLSPNTQLPTADQTFDLICMFSVITHQSPNDTEALFSIFRTCIRPTGRMFFSADLQDMEEDYKEMLPEQPTGHSAYSLRALMGIAQRTGWRVLTVEGKSPLGHPIADSILCAPA
jgi:SAM-dependent methyltransferase